MTTETVEAQLKVILSQLYEIRMIIREGQGQGFLVNAESNIKTFLNFQQTLVSTNRKPDTK